MKSLTPAKLGAPRSEVTAMEAGIIFLAATSFALLVLLVSEFSSRIFPAPVGILGLLPAIAGLVAVVLLWTPGRLATALS